LLYAVIGTFQPGSDIFNVMEIERVHLRCIVDFGGKALNINPSAKFAKWCCMVNNDAEPRLKQHQQIGKIKTQRKLDEA